MTFLGHNKTYLCYYYIKGISRGSISDNLDKIFDHILKIDGIVNILLLSFQTKIAITQLKMKLLSAGFCKHPILIAQKYSLIKIERYMRSRGLLFIFLGSSIFSEDSKGGP